MFTILVLFAFWSLGSSYCYCQVGQGNTCTGGNGISCPAQGRSCRRDSDCSAPSPRVIRARRLAAAERRLASERESRERALNLERMREAREAAAPPVTSAADLRRVKQCVNILKAPDSTHTHSRGDAYGFRVTSEWEGHIEAFYNVLCREFGSEAVAVAKCYAERGGRWNELTLRDADDQKFLCPRFGSDTAGIDAFLKCRNALALHDSETYSKMHDGESAWQFYLNLPCFSEASVMSMPVSKVKKFTACFKERKEYYGPWDIVPGILGSKSKERDENRHFLAMRDCKAVLDAPEDEVDEAAATLDAECGINRSWNCGADRCQSVRGFVKTICCEGIVRDC